MQTGTKVIKLSCSIQLSMKFFLLTNVKMPTVGILTFMSRKNSVLGLSEPKKTNFWIFLFMLSQVEHEKSFITSGPGQCVFSFSLY